MSELRAGAARVDITPPLGIRLAGYASRDLGAEWIHDPLSARALWLDDGDRAALVLSLDLCYLAAEPLAELRRRLADEVGVAREAQFINDTHTHAGPITSGGPLEERYAALLVDHVVGAASWARANAAPARLRQARAPVQVGINRRERRPDGRIVLGVNPTGSVIPWVDLALFESPEGRPLAAWFSHACHPTTLGPSHYMLSADFPGLAAALVEAELGCPALFLQGCCGDINSHPRDGLEHVAPHGRRLGHAVLGAVTTLDAPRTITALTAVEHGFDLPLDPPPPADALTAEIDAARAAVAAIPADAGAGARWLPQRRLDQAEAVAAMVRDGDVPAGRPTSISLLALGDVALVALPTEIYSTLGRAVEAASPFARTTVLGYTNGWFGYLPDAVTWDEGGYEFDVRIRHRGLPIAREAGETLVREAGRMIERAALSAAPPPD